MRVSTNGNDEAVWSSNTYLQASDHFVQQNDGNFVDYTSSDAALWSSERWGPNESDELCINRTATWWQSWVNSYIPANGTVTATIPSGGRSVGWCGMQCSLSPVCNAFVSEPNACLLMTGVSAFSYTPGTHTMGMKEQDTF